MILVFGICINIYISQAGFSLFFFSCFGEHFFSLFHKFFNLPINILKIIYYNKNKQVYYLNNLFIICKKIFILYKQKLTIIRIFRGIFNNTVTNFLGIIFFY